MSRTYRNYIKNGGKYGDSKDNKTTTYTTTRDGYQSKSCTCRSKKMKSYTKDRFEFKIRPTSWEGMRSTGHDQRESVNNANRSFKKGLRQQLKQELKAELDLINDQDYSWVDVCHVMNDWEENNRNYTEYLERIQ